MPNGGTHHCGNCRNFNINAICNLRNEKIEDSHWTTCRNWNTNGSSITGVMQAIVGEVRGGAVSYGLIPYYNGLRVDSIQEGANDTSLIWSGLDHTKLVFGSIEEYIMTYETERLKKQKYIMGSIAGDIIGSVFEWENVKSTDFHLFNNETTFTDDSVLTLATMDSILNNQLNFANSYQSYGRKYPNRGYGGNFHSWIHTENPTPYNSWGNGSSMRVSPIGWAYNTLAEVLHHAKSSAEVTHNHPEGIKGAQATAAAIFLARTGSSKSEIKNYIEKQFSYDLSRSIDEIRPDYRFDVSCQGSVPEAIIAFLESSDFESAIRLAISIGGDSDTIACIAGGISEAFYKEIPEFIIDNALRVLPIEEIKLIEAFSMSFRK